jgi:hypothetical protein
MPGHAIAVAVPSFVFFFLELGIGLDLLLILIGLCLGWDRWICIYTGEELYKPGIVSALDLDWLSQTIVKVMEGWA